jgi:GPH family glycoside/pentoside/hexuronide:cation symporter
MTVALAWQQRLAFTGIAAPVALMQGPGLAILPNMYAQDFGIALVDIALALLLSRLIFESLGALAVGVLSDRTRTRWGRRKPWIVAGAVLGLVGVFQLYMPVGRPGALHLAFWMCVVYLAWNMFDVPYTAWGNELTRDYDERSRLAVWRQGFSVAGLLGMAWLPLWVSDNSEIDWNVLRWVAWASAVLLPLAVGWALWRVPNGAVQQTQRHLGWRQAIKTVAVNKPFRALLLLAVLLNLAMGMSAAMFFLFYTSYLGLGSWFPFFVTCTVLISLLSMPLWMALLKRTSKNRLLLVGTLGFVAGLPLVHAIEPGPGALPLYAAYDALWMLFYGAVEVASRALLGDVIDYDTLKTGQERSGEYVAVWNVVTRAMLAVGASAAFAVAGWFGYDPSAASQSAQGILGLKLTMGGLPAAIAALSVALVLLLPMTRERHDVIRRRLARRVARVIPTPVQRDRQ